MSPLGYLQAAQRRLERLRRARGAAALALALPISTALAGWLVMRLVPPESIVLGARLALYAILGAALVWLLRRRVDAGRTALGLERRVPAFEGRLVTWLDAERRGDRSALFALLSRQTAAIAARHPADRLIPPRQLLWPAAGALAGFVALAALLGGSHPWQLAAQRVWFGNLFADAQPRIVVHPGDVVVRRGSDVTIRAEAHGFLPDDMQVNAAFAGGLWERAPMTRRGERDYGFVFVGVGEPIDYYVSGRGLTSSRHRIRVADLPEVRELTLTRHFPEWTGRAPERSNDGDVTALLGTRVDVEVVTDRPVSEAVLVLEDESVPMDGAQGRLSAAFDVERPATWHVAVPHEGALARISDSFLIRIAEDEPPTIEYRFPGHDRKATPIEEVALEFAAADDYRVEAVTLKYSVNGEDWQEVALEGEVGRHRLALEDLSVNEPGGARPLQPGDVISLYAEARDHASSTRSALYFVDVRPFDLRYRESQQMGGGQNGGEGGGLDIADRQRDILTATWNLINERRSLAPRVLEDRAAVLAMLQRTLAEQVDTLVTRARARGLGSGDDVSDFLRELGAALSFMAPAAERLEALALDEAVPPEQQALRHLVTAEASVRDVDVSLARADTRGTSGRSLAELMELEMDQQRNRYEMPQQPGFAEPEARDQEADWKRLEELAARQERLARQQRQNPESLPSRWEQARLERELEAMRRELESRRGSNRAGSPGALERAIAELEAAERSLEQPDADPTRREQAGEALRRAAEALEQSSRGDLQERLGRAGRRVANLEADQRRVMEALDRLQESALARARSGERIGHSDYGMQTFGAVKRRMQQDLAELRAELTELSEALGERGSEGAALLDRALREVDEVRLDERLTASAEAFEIGQPLYVLGSETLVEQALERLGRRIAEAEAAMTRPGAEDPADPLEQIRTLRRRLAEARSDDGSLSEAQVRAVARELARLAPESDVDGPVDGPGVDRRPLPLDDGVYHIRGTAPENTEALYRLTLEQLDLMEVALETADAPPVRAQQPRDAGRESSAVARYFRDLSRRTTEDDE
ncbi:MAG TPA: hypothetical protein VF210_10840 [Pseudomonadales bacterium]